MVNARAGESLREQWEREEAEARARVDELFPDVITLTPISHEEVIAQFGREVVEAALASTDAMDESTGLQFGDDFRPEEIRAYVFFMRAGEQSGRRFTEELLREEIAD